MNAMEKQTRTQHNTLTLCFFMALTGSHPGKQQDHHHPRQGPRSPCQPSEALPLQEHAEGDSQ